MQKYVMLETFSFS